MRNEKHAMKRREFVKTSLLAMGSSLLPVGCTSRKGADLMGSNSSQPYDQPQHVPQGKLNVRYIREEVPPFEIPAVRGLRYVDMVPDTLDIAERAKLGVNVLTSITDANADQEVYWLADFFRNPPVMVHDFNDWVQNVEGLMEALLLLRVATGSTQNSHIDPTWTQVLLKTVGPDGLVYVPLKGRPWSLLSVWAAYVQPVRKADGGTTQIEDPSVAQVACPVTCQRAIATMTLCFLRDRNPMWKSAIEKMIQRLKALAVDRGDYAYFPRGAWEPNAKYGSAPPMPTGFMGEETSGRMIQGLSQYYRATGYEPARELAGKLANYLRFQSQYYEPDGRWLLGADEKQWWVKRWHVEHVVHGGHGHAHAVGLLSALEYAITVGDQELVEFVRCGYEWARANS